MGLLRLLFVDESARWLTQPNTYTWSPIGQPMEVATSKARGITARLNLMGCTEYGKNAVQYREIMGNTTGQDTVAFLETLAKQADPACPTIVFADQASVHTCKEVTKHKQRWRERGMFIVYLPAYSPELNPMEGEWRGLKYHKLSLRHHQTKSQLRNAVNAAEGGIAI